MATEYATVERPALDHFACLGWDIIDQTEEDWDDPREKSSSAILHTRLRDAIERINPWISENNLDKAARRIQQVKGTNTMHENQQIHELLVRHTSVEQDLGHGNKHQTVKYIDHENPENNDFLVLNQFNVEGPQETILPDLVAFVNGIPLGVIECKDPTIAEPRSESLDQLARYQNNRGGKAEGAEELFRYNQFTVGTWYEGTVMGTYGTPKSEYKPWRDAYPVDDEYLADFYDTGYVSPQHRVLYALFKPKRLVDMLRHFTVFEEKQNGTVKKVARYQQFRAVEKALERIEHRNHHEANGGVVWHTQGSGKSLSMLFLAMKLRREKPDPTLLLVTDRQSLDNQIHSTFERCGFPNPKQAEDIEDLREKLSHNAGETITTLIQKFQLTDKEKGNSEFPVLSRDNDIYVMVDEAHRTQYQHLANNMRTALPNAFYIGFTGTPIEKEKRNTRRAFGNYIDQYTIDQSLRDGTTVEILYQGRLADIHLDGVNLDKIFDRVFQNYTDEEKAEIKKRYATERDLAEAPPRIETVALDIVEQYEDGIASPFKGMVVTTSKRAAVRYKQKLDEFHGPESRVVISNDHNDPEEIKEWAPTDAELRDIKDSFLDENGEVELLVVCDMLLTGFDAPIAQVMYLDKPLKEHSLLQAIARVNRPMEDKNHGLIIDYYGVSDHLREALDMFSADDVRQAMIPFENKEDDLEAAHGKAVSFFDNLDDIETCLQTLEDEDIRIEFNNAFKRFSKFMDIVLPDPMANPYKDDLERLSTIYARAKERYRDDTMNLEGTGKKVREIIQNHIRATGIDVIQDDPVSIMDTGELDARLEELESDEARASEMRHALEHEITVRYDEDPAHFESLQKRVEELIEKYKQNHLDSDEVLDAYREILDEMRSRQQLARSKGLSNVTELSFYHAIEDVLADETANEEMLVELTETIAEKIEALASVVEWKKKIKIQKRMTREVKLTLYQSDLDLSSVERDELTNRIIELARAHYTT